MRMFKYLDEYGNSQNISEDEIVNIHYDHWKRQTCEQYGSVIRFLETTNMDMTLDDFVVADWVRKNSAWEIIEK